SRVTRTNFQVKIASRTVAKATIKLKNPCAVIPASQTWIIRQIGNLLLLRLSPICWVADWLLMVFVLCTDWLIFDEGAGWASACACSDWSFLLWVKRIWLCTLGLGRTLCAALRSNADAIRINANQVLERFMERQ